MAKQKKRKERKKFYLTKKPAHEVIIQQIRTWFILTGEPAEGADQAIIALGRVLSYMIIPKDETSKVKA